MEINTDFIYEAVRYLLSCPQDYQFVEEIMWINNEF